MESRRVRPCCSCLLQTDDRCDSRVRHGLRCPRRTTPHHHRQHWPGVGLHRRAVQDLHQDGEETARGKTGVSLGPNMRALITPRVRSPKYMQSKVL